MKSLRNMDDKIFKCFLCNYDRCLLSLYIEGLKIVIISRIKCGRVINDKKVKSVEKILSKFKRAGVFRVTRASCDGAFFERRKFDIKHSTILELLDEQGYEIRN